MYVLYNFIYTDICVSITYIYSLYIYTDIDI